jgi:hypothetical protein
MVEEKLLVRPRGTVCPVKAEEFDKLHSRAPKFGRHNRGAKELAGGYTSGELIASWARPIGC